MPEPERGPWSPAERRMFARFCGYSLLKNLRFFEAFFILFLTAEEGGPGLSLVAAGALVGFQKLITGSLETLSGVVADRFGRRRAMMLCFACYALCFPGYGAALLVPESWRWPWLILAQALFGLGEALRTGSHKAIMLDWLEAQGRADESTRVIARTRQVSKFSAAASGLCAGLIVWGTGSLAALFWAAALPAWLGILLMASYPRELEGEQLRDVAARRPWREQLRALFARQGILPLLLQSVIYEVLIKLSGFLLQPLWKATLAELAWSLLGAGALAVGAARMLEDGLAGLGAGAAISLEHRWREDALSRLHRLTALLFVLLAGSLWLGFELPVLLGVALLALLQSARRPLLVTQLNAVMDKPQRATTLSLESQARSWLMAGLAPLLGAVIASAGLAPALSGLALLALLGLSWRPKAG